MPLTDVLCLVANCCRCSGPRSCGLADNSGRVITQPVKGLLMQKSYKSLTFYLPNAELMPLLFYYLINFCVPGIWQHLTPIKSGINSGEKCSFDKLVKSVLSLSLSFPPLSLPSLSLSFLHHNGKPHWVIFYFIYF